MQNTLTLTSSRSLESAVLTYRGALAVRARRLVRDAQDIEDLVQETLVRALARLDQVRNPETLAGWLFSIQRNIFLNDYQRRRRMPIQMEWNEETLDAEVSTKYRATAETVALRQIEYAALLDAIHALPPLYREAVVLSDMEQLPYQEIADRTGLPIGTIRSRISRGRRMVREKVEGRSRRKV